MLLLLDFERSKFLYWCFCSLSSSLTHANYLAVVILSICGSSENSANLSFWQRNHESNYFSPHGYFIDARCAIFCVPQKGSGDACTCSGPCAWTSWHVFGINEQIRQESSTLLFFVCRSDFTLLSITKVVIHGSVSFLPLSPFSFRFRTLFYLHNARSMVHMVLVISHIFEIAESYLATDIEAMESISMSPLQTTYAWISLIFVAVLIAFVRIAEIHDKAGTKRIFHFHECGHHFIEIITTWM